MQLSVFYPVRFFGNFGGFTLLVLCVVWLMFEVFCCCCVGIFFVWLVLCLLLFAF